MQAFLYAIYQNIFHILDEDPRYVCIFGGDHIYKMQVSQMLDFHKEKKSDLSISAIPIPIEDASEFGIMEVDENWRLINFVEKPKTPPKSIPGNPGMCLASMGNYIFDKEILSLIENKTIVKSASECLPYAFIISDAKNALALELNKEGLVISRSKLLLNDETNLLEMMFTIKETDFHYEKEKKYPKRNDLRQIEEIKKLIKCEMETLEHAKNESKLKYLYYEWFNKTCEDPKIILKEMKTALKKDYDASFLRIYDLIKLTYNKVN